MNDLDTRLRDAMHFAVDDVVTSPAAWSLNRQLVRRRARRRPVHATGRDVTAAGPGLMSKAAVGLAHDCATAVTNLHDDPTDTTLALAAPVDAYRPVLVAKDDHPVAGNIPADVVAIRALVSPQTIFCEFDSADHKPAQAAPVTGSDATLNWVPNPVDSGVSGLDSAAGSIFAVHGRAVSSVASIVVTDPGGGKHDAVIQNGVWWADGTYAGLMTAGPGLVIDAYDAHGKLLYDSARDDGYKAQAGSCWRLPDGQVLDAAGQPVADSPTCRIGYAWPS